MAFRHDFLFRGVFFVIILFIFRQIWAAVDPASRGMTVHGLIWYLVITETFMLSFPDVHKKVDQDIKSGAIAMLLVKPFHYPGWLYMLYLGELIPRMAINGILGFVAAILFTGEMLIKPQAVPSLIVIALLAVTIHFLVALLLSLLSFWFEETEPFFWVYHKILFTLGGLLIPIHFFPQYLQNIAESLPFSVILYRPAMLALGYCSREFMSLFMHQAMWCMLLLLICEGMYALGTKRLSINGG